MATMHKIVVALLLTATRVSSQQCTYNGKDYSALGQSSDYNVGSPNYENYEYVFNVCNQISFSDDMCVQGTSVCERVISTGEGNDVYGLYSTMTWAEGTVPTPSQAGGSATAPYISMNTDGTMPCAFGGDMESRIYLTCDQNTFAPTAEALDESYTDCYIYLAVKVESNCGGGSDPGPDPNRGLNKKDEQDTGMILCVLFFVFAIMYLVGGAVYLHKVKGETGYDMIPNREFWSAIPGLVKDGCSYSYEKVKTAYENYKNKSSGGESL